MTAIQNCFTLMVKHDRVDAATGTLTETDVIVSSGIEVFPYRFANGNTANFVYVGGRSQLTDGARRQLRLADGLTNSLETGTRSKSTTSGEREDREVSLMVEAQFIETREGSRFFGKSENWHRRAPQGTDPCQWMDTLPSEAYAMIIGQHGRVRVEGGAVLEEGYTEKYGEVFGNVQLVRVRLGEVAKLILVSEDGSETAFDLTYDAKSINAERCAS